MPFIITKKFTFESAHWIPSFPEGHKCRRLHGHSFRVDVNIAGEMPPGMPILMDFADIKEIVQPYIDFIDHYCINDLGEQYNIELLKNPTSEHIAKWLYREIKPKLPMLRSILIHETCTSCCEYFEHPI